MELIIHLSRSNEVLYFIPESNTKKRSSESMFNAPFSCDLCYFLLNIFLLNIGPRMLSTQAFAHKISQLIVVPG